MTFEPRSGVLREPLIAVRGHRRPAVVAAKEDQRVLLQVAAAQLVEHLADGLVQGQGHRAIRAPHGIGNRGELFQSFVGGVHRRVHGVERQVEEERLLLMHVDERDRLAGEGIGQILRFVDRFGAAKDRRRRAGCGAAACRPGNTMLGMSGR